MSDKNYSSMHLRNTLAILLSTQGHEEVKLSTKMSKAKCSTTIVALLYNRMLTRVLSSTRQYNHAYIRLPSGVFGKLGNTNDFEEWFLRNKYQTDMNSSDLLELGALSGWHSAFRFLITSGLIRINETNRVVLEYPIGDKLYSVEYAGNIMRGILKKKTEENSSDDKKEKVTDNEEKKYINNDKKNKDVPFWRL